MIDLSHAFRSVIEALEADGIDYVVGGSVAAANWGVVRTTRDVDIVITSIGGDESSLIESLLADNLYVPVDDAGRALRSTGGFNVLHPATGGKVDVFVESPDDEFTRSRLDRRHHGNVLGVPAWIDSVEGVILAKLQWRLESRSEVQWRDCVEMASSQILDVGHLRYWAPRLGVAADLAELLEVTGNDG